VFKGGSQPAESSLRRVAIIHNSTTYPSHILGDAIRIDRSNRQTLKNRYNWPPWAIHQPILSRD
jgi:hypothetical protein